MLLIKQITTALLQPNVKSYTSLLLSILDRQNHWRKMKELKIFDALIGNILFDDEIRFITCGCKINRSTAQLFEYIYYTTLGKPINNQEHLIHYCF